MRNRWRILFEKLLSPHLPSRDIYRILYFTKFYQAKNQKNQSCTKPNPKKKLTQANKQMTKQTNETTKAQIYSQTNQLEFQGTK